MRETPIPFTLPYQSAQLGSDLTIWKVLLALNQVMKCKSYSNNLFKQLRMNNSQNMVFLKILVL